MQSHFMQGDKADMDKHINQIYSKQQSEINKASRVNLNTLTTPSIDFPNSFLRAFSTHHFHPAASMLGQSCSMRKEVGSLSGHTNYWVRPAWQN